MKRSDLLKQNPPRLQSAPVISDNMSRFPVPAQQSRNKITMPISDNSGIPRRTSRRLLPNGLTRQQELFAMHYSEHGNSHAAAVAGGYGKSAAARGSENLRHRAVLDRIRELVQMRQAAGAPIAATIIADIATGAFDDDPRRAAVRLKAATTLAHTAGIGPVMQTRQTVEATVEHKIDLMAQIREDCAALGFDPEEFIRGRIKNVPPTIDITPEEIA